MKKAFISLLCLVLFAASCSRKVVVSSLDQQHLNLAGKWNFKEDPADVGVKERWYSSAIEGRIELPGSMASNGKGEDVRVGTRWTGSIFDSSYFYKPEYLKYRQEGNIKVPFWLQPVKYYVGAAWYQRDFELGNDLKEQHLQLTLERPHWETTVWVDGKLIGSQNSLSTSHRFDLGTGWKSGRHRISIRVDNRIKEVNPGQNSHSITDHTQTNWNGIAGQISLNRLPSVTVEEVRLYPDVRSKKVQVIMSISNKSASARSVSLSLQASSVKKGQSMPPAEWKQKVQPGFTTIEKFYDMGKDVLLWDEFVPNLYTMNLVVNDEKQGKHEFRSVFGMREVGVKGTNVAINGKPVFLRGALECAVFPLTGFPATDPAYWTKVMKTVRSYGLNHLRFHSWCPPEAAFDAADRAGVYLQVECGSWANWGSGLGNGDKIDSYIYDESERIVKAYGNHPSFIMMTYGNEPGGKNHKAYLARFVSHWKNKDTRRVYTAGAGWPVIKENDYENVSDPRIQQWEQGLKSIINASPPQTSYDWSGIISKYSTPVVSHEIGQWCVYPDFSEMKKYAGVLKPKNFEIFADRLKENGLMHLADSFLLASGKLQVLCYKSDIEASLRTRGMAGFQLLGLQDFPGQGTALVGVLNPFWEDKGYVNAEEYSTFCNQVVPLARFAKMNILNTEVLRVPLEVANYSGNVLENVKPRWAISNVSGEVLFEGTLPSKPIAVGNGVPLGLIEQALTSVKTASKLVLTAYLGNYKNSWDFFVYPAQLPKVSADILLTSKLDANAIAKLNGGGKVLLSFPRGSVAANKGGNIAVGFSSIFWNTAWTNGQAPHTLGVLCNPKHPALNYFPADYHSNWQWWDAMSHSNVIVLDSVAKGLKPIVRVIDDWVTARSLGLVFECKLGKGKLMVSGIDLVGDLKERPEASQLLYSLRKYMESENFKPAIEVSAEQIRSLLK